MFRGTDTRMAGDVPTAVGVEQDEIRIARADGLLSQPAAYPVTTEFSGANGRKEMRNVAVSGGRLEVGSTCIRGCVPLPNR